LSEEERWRVNSEAAGVVQVSVLRGPTVFVVDQPNRPVEFALSSPSLEQALGLEPFKVRQVAECGESNVSKNVRVVT
jgi:hypothetical protein